MSNMTIIEFYRKQLASLGMVDRDGLLFFEDDDQQDPVKFKFAGETRQMVLPTYQLIKAGLKDEMGNDCHAFHPICESVLTGESGTIRFLKQAIKNRLYVKGMSFITYLLKALAEGKSSRSATLKKFVASMTEGIAEPKFDDKLFRSWTNVTNYIKDRMDKKTRLMLYISSNQVIDGEKYIRAATYSHAFKQETLDDKATYFGVRLERKQDKVIIHNLLNAVFGWYPEEVGSNDQRPYYGSLIRGWAEFVLNFNKYAKGLKDIVPEYELLNAEWIEAVNDLSEFDGKIQILPFNTGSRKEDEETTQREFRVGGNRGYQEPVVQTTAEVRQTENGMIDPLSLLSSNKPVEGNIFAQGGRPVDLSKYTPLEQKLIREGRTAPQPSIITKMSLTEALGGSKRSAGYSANDFFGNNSNNVFTNTTTSNNPFTSSVSSNPFTANAASNNPFTGGASNNPFSAGTTNNGGNDLFSGGAF